EYPVVEGFDILRVYAFSPRPFFTGGCGPWVGPAPLLPADIPAARKLCEFRKPARFLLDAASSINADLVVVGTHEHNRMAELVLSSISHRVLLHATHPTLIVKGKARTVSRVLVAIEGHDDGRRIGGGRSPHPLRYPVEGTGVAVVPPLPMGAPTPTCGFEHP